MGIRNKKRKLSGNWLSEKNFFERVNTYIFKRFSPLKRKFKIDAISHFLLLLFHLQSGWWFFEFCRNKLNPRNDVSKENIFKGLIFAFFVTIFIVTKL